MGTYVVRVWLPDRPGALGQVASRIGAVRGDVVGIDILERGAGRAVDELVVELPDDEHLSLLVEEIGQVDGVDVEDVRPVADALHDPRLDALETAAILAGAASTAELLEALCVHGARTVGSEWAVVVDSEAVRILAATGPAPPPSWLAAFVAGSRSAATVAGAEGGPDDVVWAPLPGAGLALVLGRGGTPFRARERRQAAALARIVDTRFRELAAHAACRAHPSVAGVR
jgi:ACT domain